MLPIPTLRHVADFDVELAPIAEMGDGRGGRRQIIPIVGGRVSGPCFNGEIMNVGADWQTVFSSGLAELDTRYAFRTDDGAVIEITNFGFRHGSPDVMRRVAAGEDVDFHQRKLKTARFFMEQVLPEHLAAFAVALAGAKTVMAMADDEF